MSARKAIFITGAGSGIGLATAQRFARAGWFVGLSDVNRTALDAALQTVGPQNGIGLPLDVRRREDWAPTLAHFVEASGGRLDALMNNAGVASYGFLEEQSDEEIERQLDINIKGVVYGARAGLPLLKATPGSVLINISSCASLYGAPRLSIYCATKFAVRGLSEALDGEFARHGVRVACIMPFFIQTPILDAGAQATKDTMSAALKAGGTPIYTVEACAEAIWTAAHGKRLHTIVGTRGKQLQWFTRLLPGLVRVKLKADAQAGRAPGSF